MLLFLFALIVAALGLGAYAHYNTGAHDITLRTYHFIGVPDWMPAAVAAAAMLFLFFLHAVYASVRVRRLRRGTQGTGTVASRATQSSYR